MTKLTGLRFLVVEDEPLVGMFLVDQIQSLGHVVVAEAATVDAAMEMALAGDFDVAILDANLRGDKVFAVAEVLEDFGKPFFFSTGYSADHFPSPWNKHCVLEKPFTVEQLQECVDAVISSQRPRDAA